MFKYLNSKKNKGFTLIELLIVIAIIGILSAIVIIAVGNATARARDSRRLADVRQLSFVLERETALRPAVALTGCASANSSTTMCGITTAADDDSIERYFENIEDPTGATAPCTNASTGNCAYSISQDPAVTGTIIQNNDYSICFRLEAGTDDLAVGMHSIRTGARLVAGCP